MHIVSGSATIKAFKSVFFFFALIFRKCIFIFWSKSDCVLALDWNVFAGIFCGECIWDRVFFLFRSLRLSALQIYKRTPLPWLKRLGRISTISSIGQIRNARVYQNKAFTFLCWSLSSVILTTDMIPANDEKRVGRLQSLARNGHPPICWPRSIVRSESQWCSQRLSAIERGHHWHGWVTVTW